MPETATPSAAFWRDRPTFVTGATGLVGGWTVARLLELGADVVCLVRDHVPQSTLMQSDLRGRVKIVQGDVADQAVLERAMGEYEASVVIHLAAQTIVGVANRNPVSTFESNVAGTWCLCEAARRSPSVASIVLASSDKAYGSHEQQPYDESMPMQGRHPYDVSKSCSDLIGQSYAVTYDLPVAITRCGNFYGGGDLNWNRIVPGTIRSILKGERPVIRSDGTLIRDYFYVEDGVEAYLVLAQQLAERDDLNGEAFNFSNDAQHNVLDLTKMILGLMESDLEPDVRGEAVHEIHEQRLCADKARKMLAWEPRFGVEEGLRRTIAWYREFLEASPGVLAP